MSPGSAGKSTKEVQEKRKRLRWKNYDAKTYDLRKGRVELKSTWVFSYAEKASESGKKGTKKRNLQDRRC